MNREIKFRAWDTAEIPFYDNPSNSKMSYFGPDYWINDEGYIRFESPKGKGPAGDHNQERFILMQYTGLKDKNGKEIYEGDIVEWKYLKTWHKNEVRWVGGGFVVTTSGFKDDLNEPQDLSLVSILSCEIIGNIYENNELVQKSS